MRIRIIWRNRAVRVRRGWMRSRSSCASASSRRNSARRRRRSASVSIGRASGARTADSTPENGGPDASDPSSGPPVGTAGGRPGRSGAPWGSGNADERGSAGGFAARVVAGFAAVSAPEPEPEPGAEAEAETGSEPGADFVIESVAGPGPTSTSGREPEPATRSGPALAPRSAPDSALCPGRTGDAAAGEVRARERLPRRASPLAPVFAEAPEPVPGDEPRPASRVRVRAPPAAASDPVAGASPRGSAAVAEAPSVLVDRAADCRLGRRTDALAATRDASTDAPADVRVEAPRAPPRTAPVDARARGPRGVRAGAPPSSTFAAPADAPAPLPRASAPTPVDVPRARAPAPPVDARARAPPAPGAGALFGVRACVPRALVSAARAGVAVDPAAGVLPADALLDALDAVRSRARAEVPAAGFEVFRGVRRVRLASPASSDARAEVSCDALSDTDRGACCAACRGARLAAGFAVGSAALAAPLFTVLFVVFVTAFFATFFAAFFAVLLAAVFGAGPEEFPAADPAVRVPVAGSGSAATPRRLFRGRGSDSPSAGLVRAVPVVPPARLGAA